MTSPRTLLDRGRENGYLNADHPDRAGLIRAHGFWCWKLRIPLVCYERKSPRARRGQVTLDLFTTRYVLTARGMDELKGLAEKLGISARLTLSRYDAVWEDAPKASLEELARVVFRAATRFGNFEFRPAGPSAELAKLIAAIHEAVPEEEEVRVA